MELSQQKRVEILREAYKASFEDLTELKNKSFGRICLEISELRAGIDEIQRTFNGFTEENFFLLTYYDFMASGLLLLAKQKEPYHVSDETQCLG